MDFRRSVVFGQILDYGFQHGRGSFVIGAGRTDFKRNFKKEGKTLRHIILEAAQAAITDAQIDPGDIQSGVVASFASGLLPGNFIWARSSSRSMRSVAACLRCTWKPRALPARWQSSPVPNKSWAVCMTLVLVVGAEQQKTMRLRRARTFSAPPAIFSFEKAIHGDFMFPKLFARIAQVYMEKYGLTEKQLAKVAVKTSHMHAGILWRKLRDAMLSVEQAATVSEKNPRFAPPLKITDCSQITTAQRR